MGFLGLSLYAGQTDLLNYTHNIYNKLYNDNALLAGVLLNWSCIKIFGKINIFTFKIIWIIIDIGIEAVDEDGSNLSSFMKEDYMFQVLLYKIKA